MKYQKSNSNKLFISLYDTSNIPTGYELCLYANIEEIPAKSLDEIFITDLLDFYSDQQINGIINTLISKLNNNGKLYIQSIDLEQFCIYLVNRGISPQHKYVLFNKKINIQTLSSISTIALSNQSLKCLSRKYVNGFEYYLELQLNEK